MACPEGYKPFGRLPPGGSLPRSTDSVVDAVSDKMSEGICDSLGNGLVHFGLLSRDFQPDLLAAVCGKIPYCPFKAVHHDERGTILISRVFSLS